MRTRVKNQLQHVALNEGLQKKRQLWTRQGREWLEELALPPWSRRRREDLGLIPAESSSGERRRLGGISKQGNTLLRTLLVEAGQSAARCDPELGRAYQRLCRKKQHTGTAKVMVARKLVVRLYWMLKSGQPYALARMPSSPSHSVSAA